MKPIHLIPLANGNGALEPRLNVLERLAAALARTFRTPCRIRPETFDVAFSLDGNRSSTACAPLPRLALRGGVEPRRGAVLVG